MGDGTDDGAQAVSTLQGIMTKIRSEGCSTIDELITQFHAEKASRAKAEEARDKFAHHNDEAAQIIGGKSTQIGKLTQELEDANKTVKNLEAQLEEKAEKNAEPTPSTQTPPTTQKSVEEELAEVEVSLTDEQWALANELIKVEDEDKAIFLAENKAERLKFLKELTSDPDLKTRPTAFPRTTKPSKPAEAGETQVNRLLKRLSGVTHGPSGRAPVGGQGGSRTPQQTTDPRLH